MWQPLDPTRKSVSLPIPPPVYRGREEMSPCPLLVHTLSNETTICKDLVSPDIQPVLRMSLPPWYSVRSSGLSTNVTVTSFRRPFTWQVILKKSRFATSIRAVVWYHNVREIVHRYSPGDPFRAASTQQMAVPVERT